MSVPESRVEAILSNILGEDYEVKLGKSRVEDLLIGIAGIIANTPQLDNDGLIPISYIPPIAFEQCVTVQDDTARFALTTDDVQNGDCVYVNSSQIMYFVIDDTKLDQAAGYKALAAGIAAQAVADKDGNDITTTYQPKIDSQHKLSADNVDDSQSTNKFTSAAEKSLWNNTASGFDAIKNDGRYSTNIHLKSILRTSSTWSTKTWNGLTNFDSRHIWTDGDNIYYSSDSSQYVLNKATSTWSTKTWNGLTSFRGWFIWTDGDNIYYSDYTTQYVLNKATSTWSTKTWSGITTPDGRHIWTDGDNIYYSSDSSQYVLNKATSTWSTKSWSGLSNIYSGGKVWTDGDNIYYSSDSSQYVLNKATSTWSTKTWSGLTNFDGSYIWTDGNDIYYSNGTTQYILDRATSTWSTKSWSGSTSFNGFYIWTDYDNIYYGNQYVLNTTSIRPAYKPTLGTASALDVAVSGNASSTQVVKGDDTRLTDSRNPLSHNQASDTINAMTGYAKAQADSSIATSDTLNAAVGKLEYKADVNKTNISSITDHIKFSANSKTYYMQPEQPQNPEDGDIWIG